MKNKKPKKNVSDANIAKVESLLEQQLIRSMRTIPSKEYLQVKIPEFLSSDIDPLRLFLRSLWTRKDKEVSDEDKAGEKKNKAAPALNDPKTEEILLRIVNNLGTISFKAPDAQVNTDPLWTKVPKSIAYGQIGEGDIQIQKMLLFSGNASDMGYAAFLTASYRLDGRNTNVIQSIIDQDAGNEALIQEGFPLSASQSMREKVLQQQNHSLQNEPIHPLTKQVYWESHRQLPVLLVPVSADRMVGEIHRRLKEAENYYIPNSTKIRIGGTKPSNAGSVYNEQGGAIPLLMAVPPKRNYGETNAEIISRLKKQGTLFGFFGSRKEEKEQLNSFLKAVPESTEIGSQRDRKAEKRAYPQLADALLSRARDLIEQLTFEEIRSLTEVPESITAWIQQGYCNNTQATHLASHILEKSGLYKNNHPHADWRNRAIHTAGSKERLQNALKEALEC